VVSVWDPWGTEKIYDRYLIGKIRKGSHSSSITHEGLDPAKNIKAMKQYKLPQKQTTKKLLFLHAKDLMSQPVELLLSSENLDKAYRIFSEKRYRHIPVITENRNIVGILSDRDLLKELPKQELSKTKVEAVMSKPVLTVNETTEVHLIAKILFEERIGALPIIDGKKRVVGIVTRSDVLRALSQTEIFQVNA
jgi:CBS domain-containing protein